MHRCASHVPNQTCSQLLRWTLDPKPRESRRKSDRNNFHIAEMMKKLLLKRLRSKRIMRQPSRLLSQTSRPWQVRCHGLPLTVYVFSQQFPSKHLRTIDIYRCDTCELPILSTQIAPKSAPPIHQASVSPADSPGHPSARHGRHWMDQNLSIDTISRHLDTSDIKIIKQ